MSEIKSGGLDLYGTEYVKCNPMMTLGFKRLIPSISCPDCIYMPKLGFSLICAILLYPLEWWKANGTTCPLLGHLTTELFCIPPTSCHSERF